MVTILMSGFIATVGGKTGGVHELLDDPVIGPKLPEPVHTLTWAEQSRAAALVTRALDIDPCQPVVLIGHSLGASSSMRVAESLWIGFDRCVDLLVQIESIGHRDHIKPPNVETGVNIFAIGPNLPNGESDVHGSQNIGVSDASHTGIDEPPTDPDAGRVNLPGSPFDGMAAWEIIEVFLDELGSPCNCPPVGVVPEEGGVLIEPESILEVAERTKLAPSDLKEALQMLIEAGLIEEVAGSSGLQTFQRATKVELKPGEGSDGDKERYWFLRLLDWIFGR